MKFLENTYFKHILKLAVLLLFTPLYLNAQSESETNNSEICAPKTIFEVFKKKDSIYIVKPTKSNFFLVIPAIGSQPATGFFLAVLRNTRSKANKKQINIL
ncbi:hypothetical protein [Flavobacterium sp. YO12]|uniref:hypothetical protein n=1 Tax=Flavobacterium sp. YO12 TaxID=1920029 RepID=UPI001F5114B2|nr:hypothetical protein [Flavobacterium sp. YO12]